MIDILKELDEKVAWYDAMKLSDHHDTIRQRAAAAEIRRLRTLYGAAMEALTPSADTKAAYIGEFHFNEENGGEECGLVRRTVPWITIKAIMAAILARAAAHDAARAAAGEGALQ